jgi:hypothetical protein
MALAGSMLPKPQAAYFAIAAISGYTGFLAAVERDHARDIIADLMDTVVNALRPPFHLAKFAGGAAFVYAVAERSTAHRCRTRSRAPVANSAGGCAPFAAHVPAKACPRASTRGPALGL